MNKNLIALCLFFFTLAVSPTQAFSAQTYVVLDDIVFVRNKPHEKLGVENMSIKQLKNEFYKPNFPPHFFYGQNVRGEIEPGITDEVKIYGMFEKKAVTGYIDKTKLWKEPPLSNAAAPTAMILQNVSVLLLPEQSARRVLSLNQGEVVQTVGRLQQAGKWWIKARFWHRFGYIEEENTLPLLTGNLDESSLSICDIPMTGRDLNRVFTFKERTSLSKTGFFIEPVLPLSNLNVDDMADFYQGIQSAVFLSTDLYLHSFHLIFDRMLQNIEYAKIYPELLQLTNSLVSEADKNLKSYRGSNDKIQRALTYNLFYFSVAARLLDPKFSSDPTISADVDTVVTQIIDASGKMPYLKARMNPGEEDFSMYRVRGHYVATSKKKASNEWERDTGPQDPERLSRYFRAMMWYGRRPFLLKDDVNTISAILIVKGLESTGEMKRWQNIDGVLRKLLGRTDDSSPSDYSRVMGNIFGGGSAFVSLDQIDASLARFRDNAHAVLPSPSIIDLPTKDVSLQERVEMTAGFRFLGMRFTWDAHLFNQLTHPNVKKRNLPSAIDAMAVFGSSAAEELANISSDNEEWRGTYYSQQKKLKQDLTGELEKKETAYDSWLNTFSALFLPTQSRQLFAMSPVWQYKNLNSALGSWTELKHDTVLYSKQSAAEYGEGEEFEIPPFKAPSIKGYVEPNPAFFTRLSELTVGVSSDLGKAGFLTDEYQDKLQKFNSITNQALSIAKKEVEGAPITEEDYAWIRHAGDEFNRGLLLPRDTGDIIDSDLLKMALVADIATDYFSGNVLEVGVGVPQRIIVIVKDIAGGIRPTTGYVYSWYEFKDNKRWTDREWKDLVYGSDQSQLKNMRPSWYSKLQKP
jgi:hypothetical protein